MSVSRIAKILAICLVPVLIILWFVYFPDKYAPPQRELRDESAFFLKEKTGWYMFDDSTRWLITWGAENGLTLNRFDELDRGYLTPVSRFEWQWKERLTNRTNRVIFKYDSSEITGFNWTDENSSTRSATKTEGIYHIEEVSFRGGNIIQYGTVMIPAQKSYQHGLIFVHGSGSSDRDNLWYLHIAHDLARNGILVLFPDKRGCGKSEGEWHNARFEDFANDAIAAVQFLKAKYDSENLKLGILGVSQGGKISAFTAKNSGEIDFVINLSGGVVSLEESLSHEISADMKRGGLPEFLIPVLEPLFSTRVKNKKPQFWDQNGKFDITSTWRILNKPALIIYGRQDEYDNVPINKSEKLIEEFNNPHITLKIFEDSGHALQDPASGNRLMRREALELMMNWIKLQQ